MSETLPYQDGIDVEVEDEFDASMEYPTLEEIEQSSNVAELLDAGMLARLGQEAKDHIDIDDKSRTEWKDALDEGFRLAMQVADQKSYPFDNAANVIYPLITTASLQFAQRCYPSVVPGERVVQCAVIGDDSGVYQVPTDEQGNPATDPQTGQVVPEQTVVQPGAKAAQAERVSTHLSWQALYAIKGWEEGIDSMLHYLPVAGCAFRKVYYDGDNKVPAVDWIPADKFIINNAAKSIESAPRYAIEFTLYPHEIKAKQMRREYLDIELNALDIESEDGDNDADPNDDQAPRCIYEVYTRLDLDGDGVTEPYIIDLHDSGQILRIQANFGKRPENQPIEPSVDCIKYTFIPNPQGGFYDVGFGWLLGPINKTINTTINQLLDAGHWQNAPSGFIGRGIRLGRGGRIELTPNTLKPVDSTGEDLARNVWIYEHPGPSSVLFSLLQLMIEAGRDISSVQDILQGRTEKNLAPTTISTLVEQGMMTFTSIFKRVHRSLKKEFTLLYDINARTLPDHMYAYGDILDDPKAVSGQDYQAGGMDVRPITDPKMVSDQVKQARAQFLQQLAEQGIVAPKEAGKRMLEAFDIDDVEELLPDTSAQDEAAAKMAALEMEEIQARIDKIRAETQAIGGKLRVSEVDNARKADESMKKGLKLTAEAAKAAAEAEAIEEGRDEKSED